MRKVILSIAAVAIGAVALLSQTAQYPTAIATDSQLKVGVNRAQTTLLAPMSPTDTVIAVTSGTGFVANMLVAIGNEIISICGVSGNLLQVGASSTSCPNVNGRGYDGTSAASHATGPCNAGNTTGCVSNYIAAWYINAGHKEIEAMQKWGGGLLADIRAFGAVCDGASESVTAFDAAVSAGARRVFIPKGCIVTKATVPAQLEVIGEDWNTSVLRSSSVPSSVALAGQTGVVLRNLNMMGQTCNTPTNCPIKEWFNASDRTQNVVSTSYGNIHGWGGVTGIDVTGFFMQCNNTLGDCGNFFAGATGPDGSNSGGNALRVDVANNAAGALYIGRHNNTAGINIVDLNDLGSGTIGTRFSVFSDVGTGGTIFGVNQRTSTFTGDVINVNMADVSGAFTGNFEIYQVGGVVKFYLDKNGASTQASTHTATQFISSVATGTAPLAVTSTTPVANLTTSPTTYTIGGTQVTAVHQVYGRCTLGTDCAVTLTGSAAFTGSTSFVCTATDITAAAAVKVAYASGSSVTFTGTGTDQIGYHCIGN